MQTVMLLRQTPGTLIMVVEIKQLVGKDLELGECQDKVEIIRNMRMVVPV
jgi:hypothetical protein